MNYKKIYDTIIEKRKEKPFVGYTECHHILPRCLGGNDDNDDNDNLVDLSAREHFICHLLLTKFFLICIKSGFPYCFINSFTYLEDVKYVLNRSFG